MCSQDRSGCHHHSTLYLTRRVPMLREIGLVIALEDQPGQPTDYPSRLPSIDGSIGNGRSSPAVLGPVVLNSARVLDVGFLGRNEDPTGDLAAERQALTSTEWTAIRGQTRRVRGWHASVARWVQEEEAGADAHGKGDVTRCSGWSPPSRELSKDGCRNACAPQPDGASYRRAAAPFARAVQGPALPAQVSAGRARQSCRRQAVG
eukprot:scaffold910_cov396-Prasinococcus_capsulatus_cf.AAC.58